MNHNKPQTMVNQTYKIHTFLSVLTDWVFGFTISLTFGIYKNLFPFLPHSIYIYIYIYINFKDQPVKAVL